MYKTTYYISDIWRDLVLSCSHGADMLLTLAGGEWMADPSPPSCSRLTPYAGGSLSSRSWWPQKTWPPTTDWL